MNFRKFHKIRKIISNNKTGDAFGITIPRNIAMQFIDVKLSMEISGNALILSSGNTYQEGEIEINGI